MVGVTSPLYHRSPGDGRRFIIGHAVGLAAGGALLAMITYAVGSLITRGVPLPVRVGVFVAVVLLLGVLDLLGRTPHMMRQVPQQYARSMEPGWRGVIWGVDLALLFTSQKTTSLLWGALAAVVLLAPGLAFVVPAAMVLVSISALILGVMLNHVPGGGFIGYERFIVRGGRVFAGAGLLCVGLLQIPW
jgi:hypothetical protein